LVCGFETLSEDGIFNSKSAESFLMGEESNWGVIENGQAYPPKMVIVHGKYHD